MRPLGRGAFGVVFLVFKKDSGYAFATKKIVKGLAKQNRMVDSVIIEQKVLAKVDSRFCVHLHYSYQDAICVYLVLNLAPGGDLWFLLQQRTVKPGTDTPCPFRPLPDGAVRFYTASMACGLQAIHEAGFVYRDLKPHNVLLDDKGQLLISDMGLCVDISDGPVTPEKDPLGPSIRHGTCGYWPPEVIKEEPYTTGPDWWALGVTAFQLFCDRLPFYGNNDDEKNEMILRAAEVLPTRYYHGEPEDFQSLVSAFCNVDTVARLGAPKTGKSGLAEVKEHEYFNGFDWDALEAGKMPAPIQPNINDINAPSKKDIAPFVMPEDITWEAEDEAKFHDWEFMNPAKHGVEAIGRIKKMKDAVQALAADDIKWVKPADAKPAGGGCCSLM
jgi:serine/threonine protein kinase